MCKCIIAALYKLVLRIPEKMDPDPHQPVVADWHYFDEEQNLDPGSAHQREKSDRIRIKVKIRIRIRIKDRDPYPNQSDADSQYFYNYKPVYFVLS